MNYTLRNLMIAVFLMIVGLALVTSWIRQERNDIRRGSEQVTVLFAKKDIPAGTPASSLEGGGYLGEKEMAREDQPPQTLGDISDVKKLKASETIYAGETLTGRSFQAQSGLNPADQIRGNVRYASVMINPASTVGGMIQPGDSIDLLASAKVSGQTSTWVVARAITVVQTPESLKPDGVEAEGEATELSAKGDPQIYVVQATDAVMARIAFAQSAADKIGLWALLRPSQGASESVIEPAIGPTFSLVDEAEASPVTPNPPSTVR